MAVVVFYMDDDMYTLQVNFYPLEFNCCYAFHPSPYAAICNATSISCNHSLIALGVRYVKAAEKAH